MAERQVDGAQVEAWADRLNGLAHEARTRSRSEEDLLVEIINEMHRAAGVFDRDPSAEDSGDSS